MRSSMVRAGGAVDDVAAALLGTLLELGAHAVDPGPATSAARIDRISLLEQLRSALAAPQHAEMVAFGREQVDEQIALVEDGRLDPIALGRGIADQIALACKVSPFHGSRRLGIARALDADLPLTAGMLTAGRISERVADTVVSQTSHLDGEQRRMVDKQIAEGGLDGLSVRQAEKLAKQCAYDADHAGYVARLFTAPGNGPLVGCDQRRRRFEGVLAHLITIRDGGRCRDPFCDAPIRHFDHIDRRRSGGPTSFVNGRGTCARGNYVREVPGWWVEVIEDGLGTTPHTVRTTTPTGHTYDSTAGPAP